MGTVIQFRPANKQAIRYATQIMIQHAKQRADDPLWKAFALVLGGDLLGSEAALQEAKLLQKNPLY